MDGLGWVFAAIGLLVAAGLGAATALVVTWIVDDARNKKADRQQPHADWSTAEGQAILAQAKRESGLTGEQPAVQVDRDDDLVHTGGQPALTLYAATAKVYNANNTTEYRSRHAAVRDEDEQTSVILTQGDSASDKEKYRGQRRVA